MDSYDSEEDKMVSMFQYFFSVIVLFKKMITIMAKTSKWLSSSVVHKSKSIHNPLLLQHTINE